MKKYIFLALTFFGLYANSAFALNDGITWTGTTVPGTFTSGYSITYGNGLFVAVAPSGTNRVMTSPDGVTWTARTASEANGWYSVTYGNGLFVAVSADGTNRVMTSPDGVTWTARSAAQANSWRGVTYGNGLFVAVSVNGTNRVMTSPDGVTWTSRNASEQNSWWRVTYGNGLFVAGSVDGTNRVMTSPDGVTWTARTITSGQPNGIAYGNGLFVITGLSGVIKTSPDGVTWTTRTSPNSNDWQGVQYGGGIFVAVGSNTSYSQVMTSPDGITWTARIASSASAWNFITYGGGRFVALNTAGGIMYSGSFSSANCTDGIKNQDEQGIDFGGVCGAPAGKTILCQTGALSTSYTYAPITPSYTGGTDDIITTSPYTRYLSGSSFIDRFYDSSRYYTISTSNLTVSSGALSSFMNSGSTLSVTTVWGVPPGPATLDIELFQNTKVNYVKVNAPSTLQFRVKYDTADFGLYLDPITYKGGDYVRFDSTNHFQITFADSTFTLNSLEWGTFTPAYTLGQMCELIETNLVESMSGSTLGFDAVGLSNVISQITASGSTGSGATQSISSTFGFCNGDFTVLGFDLGSKICEVFTKTEGYINDQLNYKQFFSLINPYVPTTPPPLTFQTPIPKWYSDNTWGITYATGSLTDVMALKLPINRLAPTTTTRAVVVAFSLFLYFAFYAMTLVVFFWPILYAMKIVQKIMDLATGFIMGKRVTNGNLFSLPVLFWYYTGYASLVLIVIKFSTNFTPVLTSAQGWIFTFISFINQAWGNYPTFMLVTNSIFVAILGLVLGQIILKLSNFSLRLN